MCGADDRPQRLQITVTDLTTGEGGMWELTAKCTSLLTATRWCGRCARCAPTNPLLILIKYHTHNRCVRCAAPTRRSVAANRSSCHRVLTAKRWCGRCVRCAPANPLLLLITYYTHDRCVRCAAPTRRSAPVYAYMYIYIYTYIHICIYCFIYRYMYMYIC